MQQYLYMTDNFRSDNETLIMNNLVSNYQSSFRNRPGIELQKSWQKSIEVLQKHIPDQVPVVMGINIINLRSIIFCKPFF